MPCADNIKDPQKQKINDLEAMLCAMCNYWLCVMCNYCEADVGDDVFKEIQEEYKCPNIANWYNEHQKKDKIRLEADMRKYNPAEIKIIKELPFL